MRSYLVHTERFTFIEFLRMSYPRVFSGLLMWILLKTRIAQWKPQTLFVPDSIQEATVDIEKLPESARVHFRAVRDDLAAHGFLDPMLESSTVTGIVDDLMLGTCVRARHSSGMFILQGLLGLHESGFTRAEYQLLSFRSHERTFATVNGRKTFNRIPGSEAMHYPNADLGTLVRKHEVRLESIADSVIRMNNNEDLIRQVDSLQERFFRHMVARGVYSEVDPSAEPSIRRDSN